MVIASATVSRGRRPWRYSTASRMPIPSRPGRVGAVPFGQHRRHLLDQPAPDHLLGPAGDPLMQHRPRHGQHNVPWVERALRPGGLLPVRERPAAEQRHFDGPGGALAAAARESRGRAGRPSGAARSARAGRSRRRASGAWPDPGRLGEQSLRQRPHVESGASHHHRQLAAAADIGQPAHRVPGEVTGAVAAPGIHQVEAVMRRRGRAPSGWAWRCRCRAGGRPGGSRPRSTSSGQCAASASATAVFPTAVGPTSTGTLPPAKPALQLLARQLHDRGPPVHVVRRQVGGEESKQQLAHLALAPAARPALTAARQA